jgi:hypothetical protein
MDLITLAMAKAHSDSKGGYVEKHKVTANSRDFDNSEFTVMGVGFSLVSPLMPTKEELAGGKIIIRLYNSTAEEQLECTIGDVLFDDEMVYGGKLHAGNIKTSYMVAIAYKTGEWAAVGETIEKTGIYIHFPNMEEGISFELTFEWETIHPIDPKFIPGAVLPVVEISTNPSTEGAPLTAEESAAIQAAFDTGMPCVVKINLRLSEESSVKLTVLMLHMRATDPEGVQDIYAAEVSGGRYSISKMDGVWLFFAVDY